MTAFPDPPFESWALADGSPDSQWSMDRDRARTLVESWRQLDRERDQNEMRILTQIAERGDLHILGLPVADIQAMYELVADWRKAGGRPDDIERYRREKLPSGVVPDREAAQRAGDALFQSQWLRAPNQADIDTMRALARDVLALSERLVVLERERAEWEVTMRREMQAANAAEARVVVLERERDEARGWIEAHERGGMSEVLAFAAGACEQVEAQRDEAEARAEAAEVRVARLEEAARLALGGIPDPMHSGIPRKFVDKLVAAQIILMDACGHDDPGNVDSARKALSGVSVEPQE